MNFVVVYNPKSGSALSTEELKSKFAAHGLGVQQFVVAGESLQVHAKAGAYVAVFGGDGTISAAAEQLVGTGAILAPLSGGTLNHFTKDLGVPQDLDEALAALKMAKIREIDVGTMNDRVFINNSSIGLYPSSLRVRRRTEDVLGKWPALVLASMQMIVRLPGHGVKINGEEFQTSFVFVGNNDYSVSGVGSAPARSRLDQGVLSIFIAKQAHRRALMKIAIWALIGKAHLLEDFELRRASSLVIETANKRPSVSHDGELSRENSPLHYQIMSKALRVLC